MTLGQDRYARALLADSHRLDAGGLLYAVEAAHNDGPWENPEKFHRFNGVLRYSLGDEASRSTITAMGYSAGWNATDQIPKHAVDEGTVGRFGAIDPTDGGRTERYSLSAATARRFDDGEFRINAYAIRSQAEPLLQLHLLPRQTPVDGDQVEQSERRTVYGLATSRSWNLKLGGFDTVNTSACRPATTGSTRSACTPPSRASAPRRRRRARCARPASASVAENATQWLPWLRSVAGMRGDWFDFKVVSSIPENSGTADAGLGSPKLSLIFGPWAKTEYFVNYG